MKFKRKKRSRLRGSKTCFWGSRKKHRGSGHRGGVGMAGTGKRADQKKTMIVQEEYFGKHGFTSFQQKRKEKLKVINLKDIENNLDKLGKNVGGATEVDLKGFKVLSEGELKTRIVLKADAYSKKALEKIKKSGSVIVE